MYSQSNATEQELNGIVSRVKNATGIKYAKQMQTYLLALTDRQAISYTYIHI